MSGFSASWLALREPADHRARHDGLAARLPHLLARKTPVRVMDFGCGTGSNLRATAMLLGEVQEWTLVDYDPALLEEAAKALSAWADDVRPIGDQLVLEKAGKSIGVKFRIADLNLELETVLAARPDLVTASALFDLISPEWMARFAKALKASGAAFYTVLTYDGRDEFHPRHAADSAVIAAFADHQQSEKGFGIAAGPHAASALVNALKEAGFTVETGDSPWILGVEDVALVKELLPGIAGAVRETGRLTPNDLEGWLAFRLEKAGQPGAKIVTGHTDILAHL